MGREHPLTPGSSRVTRRRLLAGSGLVGAGLLTRQFVTLPDLPLEDLIETYTNESSQFRRLEGATVHVRDEGPRDAEVIVLVHGFAASLHTWEGWVTHLSDEYRIVSLDLPGFGLTGPNERNEYGQRVYVEVVEALAQALELETFTVGGNSMGGGVSWRYALEYPERVDGLVLVDAVGYQSDEDDDGPALLGLTDVPVVSDLFRYVAPRAMVRGLLESAYGDPDQVSSELVDRYHDLLRRPGNREAIGQLGAVSDPEAIDRIDAIEAPTLILWGELDTWVPPDHATRFLEDLPDASLITYGDLGHVPMEEDPERTVTDVRYFLE